MRKKYCIAKSLLVVSICVLLLTLVGCKKGFIKSGKYSGVDNTSYYLTVNGEFITIDNPYFGEDINEFYQFVVYINKVSEIESHGVILTDEEKEELKKDLPDFNPDEYIGKTYKLDFMNRETYVKGDVYDIMLWDNDMPIEVLSGEFDPQTGILTIGGAEYKLSK